jgi:hypothetical protein
VSDYTDTEALEFFATLSMPELRRRQDLCRQQQRIAYEKRLDRAMAELNRTDDLLIQAIYAKGFTSLPDFPC